MPDYNPETHFKQPKITGYRQLTQNEADDINTIKELATKVGELIDYLKQEGNHYDQRWLAEGKTDLQKGFMSLNRAVAQPTSF